MCEPQPECAIGLQFVRQPSVAPEARLALIPFSLPSTSQAKLVLFLSSVVHAGVVQLLSVKG